ncbi:MAG: SAM-dependent methyltransferase [Actinopolymorphaceae bacterium]
MSRRWALNRLRRICGSTSRPIMAGWAPKISCPSGGQALTTDSQVPPGVDPTRPSAGRMYDLVLGGTDHFEADLKAVEAIRDLVPETEDIVWANRVFLQRASHWLARSRGTESSSSSTSGRPADSQQHPRGSPVRDSRRARGLCRQRPDDRHPRTCAARGQPARRLPRW